MPMSEDPPKDRLRGEMASSANFTAEPESLTPRASVDFGESLNPATSPKQHRANVAKRLSGRSGRPAAMSSTSSIGSLESMTTLSKVEPQISDSSDGRANSAHEIHNLRHGRSSHIISQVRHWLHEEKARKAGRQHKARDRASKLSTAVNAASTLAEKVHKHGSIHHTAHLRRTSSVSSDGNEALEKLEQILGAGLDLQNDSVKEDKAGSYFPRRASRLLRKQSTIVSSDTEYQDSELHVPSADVILDNSKTMGYSGGAAASQISLPDSSKRAKRDKEGWLHFKYEIVRLSHTLKLPRWRRVPLEQSEDIAVERLSGALTNAVYVVSPPVDLPPSTPDPRNSTTAVVPTIKRPPPKLLLRIYGPQVEHLIDRDSELQILRRLARKNIGPKLLGTFTNGRFEQFLNARTLTASDLRMPETSKQIAKRMRELHEGIELLDEERNRGPFVWQNWDKWVQRCENVISLLDQQALLINQRAASDCTGDSNKGAFVCGVQWSVFRQTVDRYRKWLNEQHGGSSGVKQDLVFAHNDTQYGNLLRIQPSGESPLLTPANEHKQLVVIDFEYASANVPGLEFANHFVQDLMQILGSRANVYQTEWCYNYHDPEKSHILDHTRYPALEEQKRFLNVYVQHRPRLQQPSSKMATATTPGPSSSISSFMLDSRGPPAQYKEDEARREEATETEVNRLMHQTRLWRIANSAQWVAWGIVQAKVPDIDDALAAGQESEVPRPNVTSNIHEQGNVTPRASDPLTSESTAAAHDGHGRRQENPVAEGLAQGVDARHDEDDEKEGEEFDYLAYAQERAMFFWGDVLQLGIVKREDLPAGLLEKVKIVEY